MGIENAPTPPENGKKGADQVTSRGGDGGNNGLNLVDLSRPGKPPEVAQLQDRPTTPTDHATPTDSPAQQAASMIRNDSINDHLTNQKAKIASASPDDVRAMMAHNDQLIAAYQKHLQGIPDRIPKSMQA